MPGIGPMVKTCSGRIPNEEENTLESYLALSVVNHGNLHKLPRCNL